MTALESCTVADMSAMNSAPRTRQHSAIFGVPAVEYSGMNPETDLRNQWKLGAVRGQVMEQ